MVLLLAAMPGSRLKGADTLQLPGALQQKLHRLQQEDRLDEWINARLDYIDEAPAARMSLLMQLPQDVWRTYRTYSERLTWFDMLALQGYYQLQTGNILASIAAYEKALAFYEGYPLPDAQVIEYVLKPLGNNYTRLADYGMALHIHRKTLVLAGKQADKTVAASVLGNMAVCARWQGDFPAAVLYCRQAMERVAAGSALQGLVLSTYADILTEQQQYDSAFLFGNRALQLLAQHQSDQQAVYWYGGALQQMATIALHRRQYAKAIDGIRKAETLYQQYYPATRQREKAKLNVLAGNVYLQTGDAVAAWQCFCLSLQLLLPSWKQVAYQPPARKLLYGENTLGDALEGAARSLQAQGRGADALPWLITSIQAQAALRQEFFYTASKLREIAVTRNRSEAAMQLAFSLWSKEKHPFYAKQLLLIAELSKAQVLWDEQQSRSPQRAVTSGDSLLREERRLQQAVTYYRHEVLSGAADSVINNLLQQTEYKLALLQKQRRSVQKIDGELLSDIETLLTGLPADVMVLEFFEGKDGCYLIELDNAGVHAVNRLATGTALQDSILLFMRHWFTEGPNAMINAPEVFYNSSYHLYKSVFASQQWRVGKRYLVIPDGVFNYLPFDAFVTGAGFSHRYSDWPFLYKKAVLSKAYSLQIWHQQQHASYTKGGITGFFVSADQGRHYAQLATAKEYTALKAAVNGAFYFDSLATFDRFRAAMPGTALLQVSTHAALQPEPLLQLYDAPFYLSDLQYYPFHPSLVVLSACRTADGTLLQGEGINSLQRGFVAAGAGGVLGSLWNVNDATTIALSQLFYKHLSGAPDPGMALYRAKAEWLQQHRDNAVLQLPYYWAAFEYCGHLQPVTIKGTRNWYLIGGIVAALLLAACVVLMVIRQKRRRG